MNFGKYNYPSSSADVPEPFHYIQTFMLGMNQGYSAAKRHALEEVAPGHSEAQHSDLSHLPPAHTTSGVVDTAEQHPKR